MRIVLFLRYVSWSLLLILVSVSVVSVGLSVGDSIQLGRASVALGMVGEMSCCGSTDCLIKESNQQHCYHYYHRQVDHYYLLLFSI